MPLYTLDSGSLARIRAREAGPDKARDLAIAAAVLYGGATLATLYKRNQELAKHAPTKPSRFAKKPEKTAPAAVEIPIVSTQPPAHIRNREVPPPSLIEMAGPRNRSRKNKSNGNKSSSVAVVAVAGGSRRGQASARVVGDGIVIRRREFVRDVVASDAASLVHVAIAPSSFPWLKNYQRLYETYAFNFARFDYIPNVPTTYTGSVVLAPDFDPGDAHDAGEGKPAFLNMKNAVSGTPWSRLSCHCSRQDLQKRKSLYTGLDQVDTSDLRMSQAGNLFIYTVGQGAAQDGDVMGELWVEYECHFSTPQLVDPKGGDAVGQGAIQYLGTSQAQIFGTVTGGSIPATFDPDGTTTSTNTWTFSEGWSGYFTFDMSGTDINFTVTGSTAVTSLIFAFDNNTRLSACYFVNANQGDTFIANISNTTWTSSKAIFVQGPQTAT